MNRVAAVAAARELIGTRYSHHGRKPGVGIDCIGVLLHAWKAGGIKLEDYRVYGPLAESPLLLDRVAIVANRVNAPEKGDIVVLYVDDRPCHLAIVDFAPEMEFIHVTASTRKVVAEPCGLHHRIAGFWTPKEAC